MLQKASLALNGILAALLLICLFWPDADIETVAVETPKAALATEPKPVAVQAPAPAPKPQPPKETAAPEIAAPLPVFGPPAPQKTVLYKTVTDDQRYTIELVSDEPIELKGRQIDEKTVVFDNLIMTGTVNGESPFRMVYLLQVVDRANQTLLVVTDETGNQTELMPSFLYSMTEPGYYTLEIFTAPAMVSNVQLTQKTDRIEMPELGLQTLGDPSKAVPGLKTGP